MLKRKQRLSRREFEVLLKKGKRVAGNTLTFIYFEPPKTAVVGGVASKCGVVVSKKTACKASLRNRLRRRIYDVLASEYPSLPGCYCAVLTRPKAAQLTHQELQTELSTLIQKVHK